MVTFERIGSDLLAKWSAIPYPILPLDILPMKSFDVETRLSCSIGLLARRVMFTGAPQPDITKCPSRLYVLFNAILVEPTILVTSVPP